MTADPLAPVERLLDEVLSNPYYLCSGCDDAEGPSCTCGNEDAREAVRLLLDVARLHVPVTHDLPQHAALLAFARGLEEQ